MNHGWCAGCDGEKKREDHKRPGNAFAAFPGGLGLLGHASSQNGWQFLAGFGHFGAGFRNLTSAEIVAETLLLIGTPSSSTVWLNPDHEITERQPEFLKTRILTWQHAWPSLHDYCQS